MRILSRVLGFASVCVAALFAAAFYYRYWLWRDCFNELGRCYDPVGQDVYLEQSGMVWGGLAVLAFLTGLVLVAPGLKGGRR